MNPFTNKKFGAVRVGSLVIAPGETVDLDTGAPVPAVEEKAPDPVVAEVVSDEPVADVPKRRKASKSEEDES